MNALSREGCRHFEVFDQADEYFDRDVYKVEDLVVKDSAGARSRGGQGAGGDGDGSGNIFVCLAFVGSGGRVCLLNFACFVLGVARRAGGRPRGVEQRTA
jgi:hypothetical protein